MIAISLFAVFIPLTSRIHYTSILTKKKDEVFNFVFYFHKKLNEAGITDYNGEPLSEDGVYGDKTKSAHNQALMIKQFEDENRGILKDSGPSKNGVSDKSLFNMEGKEKLINNQVQREFYYMSAFNLPKNDDGTYNWNKIWTLVYPRTIKINDFASFIGKCNSANEPS